MDMVYSVPLLEYTKVVFILGSALTPLAELTTLPQIPWSTATWDISSNSPSPQRLRVLVVAESKT